MVSQRPGINHKALPARASGFDSLPRRKNITRTMKKIKPQHNLKPLVIEAINQTAEPIIGEQIDPLQIYHLLDAIPTKQIDNELEQFAQKGYLSKVDNDFYLTKKGLKFIVNKH